jgi:hypothetical protein
MSSRHCRASDTRTIMRTNALMLRCDTDAQRRIAAAITRNQIRSRTAGSQHH